MNNRPLIRQNNIAQFAESLKRDRDYEGLQLVLEELAHRRSTKAKSLEKKIKAFLGDEQTEKPVRFAKKLDHQIRERNYISNSPILYAMKK
ncbi:hypothetical protein [Prosthecobacter dejongeii]|uniref:Uncharacterized protein n=1 Tax=Prosthecobacter dejongeii TaxID=48465 RepID=A0A7W7YIL0_9BACT|nr:hypothetical protein [Prosthecobacter dejongeii]MBB5036791.1 hypothetical protein [Prosthecobacter dejongeii]